MFYDVFNLTRLACFLKKMGNCKDFGWWKCWQERPDGGRNGQRAQVKLQRDRILSAPRGCAASSTVNHRLGETSGEVAL